MAVLPDLASKVIIHVTSGSRERNASQKTTDLASKVMFRLSIEHYVEQEFRWDIVSNNMSWEGRSMQ